MGVDVNVLKLLKVAKNYYGCDFSETLMVGRQRLYVSLSKIKLILEIKPNESGGKKNTYNLAYLEWILHQLGAKSVSAMDVSDYEGANVLHDLNLPLPKELIEKFSCVLEFGTLEHVFNFPEAISSLMKCLKVGGHIINYTVANNFCGHGFYQFSPELFFRIFSEENGFETMGLFVTEGFRDGKWYAATDFKNANGRMQIFGPRAVMICFVARKKSTFLGFKRHPMQADYETVWSDKDKKHADHNDINISEEHFWNKIKKLNPLRIISQMRADRMFQKPFLREFKINQDP
jgi:hypothetical protein